jgi:CheY-like chemotaxis protein
MNTAPRPPGTVLLVEDYDAIRLLLKEYLEKMGFRVVEASDGEQAVESARREGRRLSLILMDINLPGLDGLGATRQIREIEGLREVPIVACTARSSEEGREAARAAGCTELVPKPIDKTTMRSILDRYFLA